MRQNNALVYKVPIDDLSKTLLPVFCTGRYFNFWIFNNSHWTLSWAIWILKPATGPYRRPLDPEGPPLEPILSHLNSQDTPLDHILSHFYSHDTPLNLILNHLNCQDLPLDPTLNHFNFQDPPMQHILEPLWILKTRHWTASTILPATGRQYRGCIIPQAVTQSSAPENG